MTLFKSKATAVSVLCGTLLLILLALLTPMQHYPYEIRDLFKTIGWLDEFAHFSLFAGLALFFKLSGCTLRRTVFALVSFTGGSEFLQQFFGRTASISDGLFDLIGLLFGLLFYYTFFTTKTTNLLSENAIVDIINSFNREDKI